MNYCAVVDYFMGGGGGGHKWKLHESCFINTILVASATYLKMTRDLTSGPLTTTRVFPSMEVTEKT